VRVDVDAGALGLFQQRLQVQEVVAGDQYPRSLPHAGEDAGRGGIAEMLGVGLLKQLHGPIVDHSGLEDHVPMVLGGEVHVGQGLEQRLVHEGVDLLVPLAQDAGMVGVGGDALQPIDEHLLLALDVLVLSANPRVVQATPLAVC